MCYLYKFDIFSSFMDVPKSFPEKFQKKNKDIFEEYHKLDKDNLPLLFRRKCTMFAIEILNYVLENFDDINLYDYIDYLGSYYLQFSYNSKGEEVQGILISDDEGDISTDYFLELNNLDEPYDYDSVRDIRDRFVDFLQGD